MDESKRKTPEYTVDFVTALPLAECSDRLERDTLLLNRGLRGKLAPIQQFTVMGANRTFIVERRFPGALHPIRFAGSLDPDDDSPGTWVHGGITHDTENQVLVEGLLLFVTFFALAALLFLRLKTRGLAIVFPLFLVALIVFSIRWRALHSATLELVRWVRRRLYLTAEQVRQSR